MKKHSNELKVGIMIIVFALAGFFILYFMGDIKKEEGIPFVIQFSQAGGIGQGDSVRYAGVIIGKVKHVEIRKAKLWLWDDNQDKFIPVIDANGNQIESDQAFVTVLITNKSAFQSNYPIFTDKTEVTISTSMMNERWIEIKPKPGRPLKKDEILLGHSPITIEEFIAKSEKTLEKVSNAADSLNKILEDEKVVKDIKESLDNFRDLTFNLRDASATANEKIKTISGKIVALTEKASVVMDNINRQITLAGENVQGMTGDLKRFTNSLNRIASSNEGDIRVIVNNLVVTSKSLKKTMDSIEKLVTKKEFNEDILSTLHNIKNASEDVEGIAADIRAVTSDGQIREDLKLAVQEARSAAQGANKLIKELSGTLGIEEDYGKKNNKKKSSINLRKFVVVDAEAEYDNDHKEVVPNLNATILPENKSSFKLGVDSLGFDNKWNFQYRAQMGRLVPRFGLVRSKLGFGADIDLGKSFGLFLDAYDPRDWQVDMTGRIKFSSDFYLHGGVRDIFDGKRPIFGVGKRF